MHTKKTYLFLAFLSLLISCTNDNPDTLADNIPIPSIVQYKQNVKSIIDNNCISCHAATPINGAPMSLVTYNQLKIAIQNRPLINRISLNNGNSLLMPEGGPKLPQDKIDIIKKWQQDGLLE